MSMQVNNNSVEASKMWETLLSSIGDVQKTTTAEGKEALTVTVGEGESVRTITMVPDDLEQPQTADSAALDSLVSKIAGLGFEMTDAEVATFKEAVTQAYSRVRNSPRERGVLGRRRSPPPPAGR